MNHLDYNQLTLNGTVLRGQKIIEYCKNSSMVCEQAIGEWMQEWLDESPYVEVQTSGSTGQPKVIQVQKEQMLASAKATAEFFGFAENQTALLSLPVNHIAGKMMVVRALYSRLNLLCQKPNATPIQNLKGDEQIDFAPFTPMQMIGIKDTLGVRTILLGGSPINPEQEAVMQKLKSSIYHGYGMTETLSHVAVRRVNGSEASESYQAVGGVRFSQDEYECLVIHVPFLEEDVVTTDVVNLHNEREFVWLGRRDYVINSGGVKLHPELIEKKLAPYIPYRFFIAGVADSRLGEKVVLFIEKPSDGKLEELDMDSVFRDYLDQYERPREVIYCDNFVESNLGKLLRQQTIAQNFK